MPKITQKDRRICENVNEHLAEEVTKIVFENPAFDYKLHDTACALSVISMLYKKGLIAMRYAK